jgi:hypothetical protein
VGRRRGQYLFGIAAGLLVAVASYLWITDPGRGDERRQEEAAVIAARAQLRVIADPEVLEFVDPLAPNRKVGKAYVYRKGDGWQVSGHYRRGPDDRWHPYLMSLDAEKAMTHLRVRDAAVTAVADPRLEAMP